MTDLATVVRDLNLSVTRDRDSEVVKQMQSGLVVELHIGRWRATKQRTLEDLGITIQGLSEQEREAWWTFLDDESLGTAKLLPKNILLALQNLESRGRHILERYGLQTRWGTFVPVDRLKEWYEQDQRCRQMYFYFRDEVVRGYDLIRTNLVTSYRAWASQVYRRINSLSPTAPVDNAWIDAYADRFARALPPPEVFAKSFFWEHRFHFLPLPDQASQENLEREKILNALELEAEQKRILQGVMRAEAEDARKAKQDVIDAFMRDVQRELSTMIQAACTDILESFQENHAIVGGNIKALRSLLAKVSELNIIDDVMIAGYLEDIRQIVGANRPYSQDDNHSLAETLHRIQIETTKTLEQIQEEATPRSQRLEIELPAFEPIVLRRNKSRRLSGDAS